MDLPDFGSMNMPNMKDFQSHFSGVPKLPSFGNFPRLDSNIFNGMGWNFMGKPRRSWWEGDNVCVDKKIIDGDGIDGINIRASPAVLSTTKVSSCEETEGVYSCKQMVAVNGNMKTVLTTFSCCHGFKLDASR